MSLFPDDRVKGTSAADLVDHLNKVIHHPPQPEPGRLDDPAQRDQYWMRRGARDLVDGLIANAKVILSRERET